MASVRAFSRRSSSRVRGGEAIARNIASAGLAGQGRAAWPAMAGAAPRGGRGGRRRRARRARGRPRGWRPRVPPSWSWRRATASGGRVLNEDIGGGKVVEVGGQWIGPTQDRLAALAARARRRDLPDLRAGREPARVRRQRAPLPRARSRASTRLVLLDVEQAQTRLNRLARKVPLDAPWEAPGRGQARRPDAGDLDAPQHGHEAGPHAPRARSGGGLGRASRRTCRCCTCSSTSTRPAALELLFDTEGGAQQDRFVGGSQLIALRMAEELGTSACVLGAPGARASSTAPDGVTVRADERESRAAGARSSRSRPRSPAGSPTTRRCPATATSSPSGCRSARWPSAWRSTTSRSGARRASPGRPRATVGPVRLTFDNSPPDGSPGVLLGFLEGRHARELGRVAAGGAPHRGDRLLRPPVRPARRDAGRLRRAALGRGGVDARLLRLPHAHRRAGRATARRCASRSAPLHWAGAEYATVWNGYMDGAVRSGDAAAAAVVKAL